MRHFLVKAGFGLAISTAIVVPAWAVDVQALSDRLTTAFEQQGINLKIGSAREDGNDVTLSNVTAIPKDAEEATEGLTYDSLLLENVSEKADGSFTIGRVELPAKTGETEEGSYSLSPVTAENLYILSDDRKMLGSTIQADRMFTESISFSIESGEFLRIENIEALGELPQDGKPATGSVSIGRFSIDTQKMEDDETAKQLADAGFSKITGQFTTTGTYDQSNATATVEDMTLTVDNAAALKISAAFSNITEKLAAQIQEASQKLDAVDQEENPQEAMRIAQEEMLPLYSQIGVDNAMIRIEDSSLTNKVIDDIAARQSVQPEQLKLQVAMMAPAILAAYVPAEFAQQIGTALQTYLSDPQSLAIEIAPQGGLTVGDIIAAATSDPSSLPALLGATVTANED